MADLQYFQYPAGQAGYTGDSSYSQSGYGSVNIGAYTLEESEFAEAAAVKARTAVEAELHDCQTQLEEATRVKNEVESRCLQLSREKNSIQTQLEEAKEDMAEVIKDVLAQLSEVTRKSEHLARQSEDTNNKIHRLVRDLESKLELEQTRLSRLEGSSSARWGGSTAPAGNGGYGANQCGSNQSQYSYGQQPSASLYSTGRERDGYDRGCRGGGGYGSNENDISSSNGSLPSIGWATFPKLRKEQFCRNCGFPKFDAGFEEGDFKRYPRVATPLGIRKKSNENDISSSHGSLPSIGCATSSELRKEQFCDDCGLEYRTISYNFCFECGVPKLYSGFRPEVSIGFPIVPTPLENRKKSNENDISSSNGFYPFIGWATFSELRKDPFCYDCAYAYRTISYNFCFNRGVRKFNAGFDEEDSKRYPMVATTLGNRKRSNGNDISSSNGSLPSITCGRSSELRKEPFCFNCRVPKFNSGFKE